MNQLKWRIIVESEYISREQTISSFEQLVNELKAKNYPIGGGGNSSASCSITGPREIPLSDSEIRKLRGLIS